MGKPTDNYTAEQRAVMTERARLLKSPSRQAEQDRMRMTGEKLGLNHIRKAKTTQPTPQEPTPPKRKRGHVGRKRSIAPEPITEGIRLLRDKPKMSVKAARQTLRDAGIEGEDGPLYRLIIKPAYGGMSE